MTSTGDDEFRKIADYHRGPIPVTALAAAGVSKATVRWALDTGRLRRLRRGIYVPANLWDDAGRAERHLLLLRAALLAQPDAVAVAQSAAAVLGLPLPTGPPERPQVLHARQATRSGGRGREGGGRGRRAWLTDEEIWVLSDGLRVTAPARTVVDCARHLDRGWSLAVADAARRGWQLTTAQLLDGAARNPFAPGHPAAVWVAKNAVSVAESPLESLARAAVMLGNHPAPTPQAWVRTYRADYRVDLLDEEHLVIVEADGRLKYATADDLWREKLREDALRDAGFEVVRFTLEDHRRPAAWLMRYRAALRRAEVRTS